MTKRQLNLKVNEKSLIEIKKGNIMQSYETFKAFMSTIKKGQYKFEEIAKMIYKEKIYNFQAEEIRQWLSGLSINESKNFNFSETLGLDLITVR